MNILNTRKKIDGMSYSKWILMLTLRGLRNPTKNLTEKLPLIFALLIFIYYRRYDDSFFESVLILSGLLVVFFNPIILLDIWSCIKERKRPDSYASILGVVIFVMLALIINSNWIVGIGLWSISTSFLLILIIFIRMKSIV